MKHILVTTATLVLLSACASDTAMPNGESTVVSRAAPKYPIYAARNNIEGWVQMSFDVDPQGKPTNIDVIASEPEKLFDKQAVKALQQWRYTPKIVDGKAVIHEGLTVQLDFRMGS